MPTTLFPDATWKSLVDTVASGFAMEEARKDKLLSNATAKLIGALPYLAGCRESERCAIAHLSAFVIGGAQGSARKLFDHKQGDDYDVLARLSAVAWFEGGDPAILSRGMKCLATIMIEGYKRDVAADKAAGRYNPVGSGAWDADTLLKTLKAEIAALPNAEMDEIFGAAKGGFWDF
jgi:hypothetical protein